jgi:uncharacterized membrane protein (UPF0127 family)
LFRLDFSFIFLICGLFIFKCSFAEAREVRLCANNLSISAELAVTTAERSTGLMGRSSLCEDCGMLFIFPSSDKWSFWSKNTPLALSAAFVFKDGRIGQISDMSSNDESVITSVFEVSYVLEMNRGWFKKNGVKVGDYLYSLNNDIAPNVVFTFSHH